MKVLLLGDTHFGNHKQFGGPLIGGINRRCQELLDAVEREVRMALAEMPDLVAVLQVGDFFDQARPSAAIVEATIRMMKKFPMLEWHIMKGNHDMATFDAPSAIAPLGHIPGIFVYEQPTLLKIGNTKFGLIPYVDHSAFAAMHMSKHVLAEAEVLIMHYGVVELPTRPDQISIEQIDAIWRQYMVKMWTLPYSNVFSGHEHGERAAGCLRPGVGLGSFADLDWSATRFSWPKTAIFDSMSQNYWEWEVDGPVYISIDPKSTSDRDLICSAINSKGAGYYVEGPAEKEDLLRALTNIGLIQGYRIKPAQELLDGEDESKVERNGFSDLEQPIAEVLDSQGADLADEATHRVWASCIQHMKEQ